MIILYSNRFSDSAMILDWALTYVPSAVLSHGVLDPINNLDHNPIFIELNFSLKHRVVSKPFFVWDYNNGDFLGLNNALHITPWELIIINSPNVNSALSNITNVINQTLKAFIPTKTVYPFTRELRLLIRKRSRYYKRWLKTKNRLLNNKTRNLVQRKIKLAKQKYNERFMSKLNVVKTSDLNYWKLLNQKWKPSKKRSYPSNVNGRPIHDNRIKCNLFNEYFTSISNSRSNNYQNLPPLEYLTDQRLLSPVIEPFRSFSSLK